MTAIASNHARVFRQLIDEHRQTLLESLATGTAADYPAYRQLVGRLEGIADAINISELADSKISGEQ